MEDQQNTQASRPGFGFYIAGSALGLIGINNLLSSIDKLMETGKTNDTGYAVGYLVIPSVLIIAAAICLIIGYKKSRAAKKK